MKFSGVPLRIEQANLMKLRDTWNTSKVSLMSHLVYQLLAQLVEKVWKETSYLRVFIKAGRTEKILSKNRKCQFIWNYSFFIFINKNSEKFTVYTSSGTLKTVEYSRRRMYNRIQYNKETFYFNFDFY